jgi:hypothetical protein
MRTAGLLDEVVPASQSPPRLTDRRGTLCLLALLLLVLPWSAGADARVYLYPRAGQVLEIDLDSGLAEGKHQEVLEWVRSTADALAGVYGRWPRDRWRVKVKAISGYGSDPVPWAQVNRGDPDTVSLYIDRGAGKQRLVSNWTAYHEFSHLLIPYRGWGDMWFSEGLASYYQNLLQARQGVFDEREMWQRLHDGFVRGRSNRRPDLTLAELSPDMHENRSYMRVYWSGAWYFLTADLQLRRRTGGRQSLDTALGALNDCCADLKLSARDIARRLDAITGQAIFIPLFEDVAGSLALPAFEGQFASLGIRVSNGRVSLDETHESAPLRSGFARWNLP